jgi:ATP synthase protein I
MIAAFPGPEDFNLARTGRSGQLWGSSPCGQIIDATIVAAPKQLNPEAEKREIGHGRIPEGWKAKPAELRETRPRRAPILPLNKPLHPIPRKSRDNHIAKSVFTQPGSKAEIQTDTLPVGLVLDRAFRHQYCALRRKFCEFFQHHCCAVASACVQVVAFLAFCGKPAYRAGTWKARGAWQVGQTGNGRDGPPLDDEGHLNQRRENENHAQDDKHLRARLERLTDALAAQRRDERQAGERDQDGKGSTPGALGSVLSLAFRVLSEFVAAVIVGAFIGWGIDRLSGASPAFLIVFLLFGAAAGFWNVYRIGTGKPGAGGR